MLTAHDVKTYIFVLAPVFEFSLVCEVDVLCTTISVHRVLISSFPLSPVGLACVFGRRCAYVCKCMCIKTARSPWALLGKIPARLSRLLPDKWKSKQLHIKAGEKSVHFTESKQTAALCLRSQQNPSFLERKMEKMWHGPSK